MKVSFSVKNLVGDGLAREGDYFKSALVITLEKGESLKNVDLVSAPKGLQLETELSLMRFYVSGVIAPLEEWTDILSYESKKYSEQSDDALVGGQVSLTNQTPLTYGYLRKMNRQDPDWLHYSGINYPMFGKSAYVIDNGSFVSSVKFRVEHRDKDGEAHSDEYSSDFPIVPILNANDFLERYKKYNTL